jgi:tRNA(Ile)-lysidine synthase
VLRTLPPRRRRNALRYWIAAAGLRAPPARRLEEIAGPLLGARADAAPFVSWGTVRVQREADLLSLRAAPAPGGTPGAVAELPWSWRRARRLPLPEGGALTLAADPHGPIDLELLPALLAVRRRRGGERLRLLPGGPRRTLKNLLQEAHVPHEERARLPLLFAGATLLAAGARWVDAQVQARATSRRRARLIWSAS